MGTQNYFEFYGLPEAFTIDEALLKQKYYENTRQYHPDHFSTADEAKQARALELTTLNNNAYKTLKDFNKRVHYILNLHGLVTEGEKHNLSPAFLAEMMDLNELLMELEFDADAEKLQQATQTIEGFEKENTEELLQLAKRYDAAPNEAKGPLLLQIKEAYHKSKYILRLKDSLSKFAAL